MLMEEEEKLRKEWRLEKNTDLNHDIKSFDEWLMKEQRDLEILIKKHQQNFVREYVITQGFDLNEIDARLADDKLRNLATLIAKNPGRYQGDIHFSGSLSEQFESYLEQAKNGLNLLDQDNNLGAAKQRKMTPFQTKLKPKPE